MHRWHSCFTWLFFHLFPAENRHREKRQTCRHFFLMSEMWWTAELSHSACRAHRLHQSEDEALVRTGHGELYFPSQQQIKKGSTASYNQPGERALWLWRKVLAHTVGRAVLQHHVKHDAHNKTALTWSHWITNISKVNIFCGMRDRDIVVWGNLDVKQTQWCDSNSSESWRLILTAQVEGEGYLLYGTYF